MKLFYKKEVFIDENKETLKTSYEMLHREIQELFKENWDKIKKGSIIPKPQIGGGVLTTNENTKYSNHLSEGRVGIYLLKNLRKDIKCGKIILKNFMNLSNKEKEIVLTWRNNKRVRRYSFQDHVISNDEHNAFIQKLKDDAKNFYWLVKEDDKYIGVVSLNRVDPKNKNAYLGIYANPKLKGVGGILMDCFKKVAFNIAKLHTLKLEVIETNDKTINFYKRCGFRKEGRLKEFVHKNGKWLDVIIMGENKEHKW